MNYVKAAIAENHQELKTTRATVIRTFILKCFEKKALVHSSDVVWSELKKIRILLKKEFVEKGLSDHVSARLLFLAEAKLKKLFDGEKIKLHTGLPSTRFGSVLSFYTKYEKVPGEIDMKIASHALCFEDPALITTDDHFFVLVNEFEKELHLLIVHDDNAFAVLRMLGWD
jgi:hypothetical protein